MKKVKIMLFSLAILAVVGGALAFKVKGNLQYCTTFYDVINKKCPAAPQACLFGTFTTIAPTTTLCTTLTNGDPDEPCVGITDCTISKDLKRDN